MAQIPGTVIASKISPGDTILTFPTHEDIYGQGGLMSVASFSELTSIPAARQKVGMMVYVNDVSLYYTVSSISYPLTSFTPVKKSYEEYVNTNFVAITGGTITGSLSVNNDVTVFGNLTAKGTATFFNTIFSTTSSISVIHIGNNDPALYVSSNGTGDLASFYDYDSNVEMFHVGGANGTYPNVGIKTSTPSKALTVNGEISANSIIWDESGNSGEWNNVYNWVNATSGDWNDAYTTQAYLTTSLSSIKPTNGDVTISNSNFATIAGGSTNSINAADYSNINGGIGNYLSGSYSVIGGGYGNDIHTPFTVIGGGSNNIAAGVHSSILGGQNNTNYQENAHIIGSFITAPLSNYTYVNNLSSEGIVEDAYGNSNQWNSAYTSVALTSGSWDSAYTSVLNTSASWNEAYTNLISNSAAYLSGVDLSFLSVSANWDNVYSSVASTSGNWNYAYNAVNGNSLNWTKSYFQNFDDEIEKYAYYGKDNAGFSPLAGPDGESWTRWFANFGTGILSGTNYDDGYQIYVYPNEIKKIYYNGTFYDVQSASYLSNNPRNLQITASDTFLSPQLNPSYATGFGFTGSLSTPLMGMWSSDSQDSMAIGFGGYPDTEGDNLGARPWNPVNSDYLGRFMFLGSEGNFSIDVSPSSHWTGSPDLTAVRGWSFNYGGAVVGGESMPGGFTTSSLLFEGVALSTTNPGAYYWSDQSAAAWIADIGQDKRELRVKFWGLPAGGSYGSRPELVTRAIASTEWSASRWLGNSSSQPLTAQDGDFYYNTSTSSFNSYHNNSWKRVLVSDADILPTVTNYLSTNNVILSSATILDTLSARSYVNNPTGKTIYVDANTGSDTRDGFSKYDLFKPFATISAAVNASAIGDTIYVRAGNHTIANQISMNGKGNLYFELGAKVTVSNNITAFSLTANESKTISGYGEFTCSGTGGLWTQSDGTNTVQLVTIQCANIINLTGAGIVFNIASGVVGVDAPSITCLASTIVNITGTTSDCFYKVDITYCGKLVNIASTVTTGGFTANCWTVQIYGLEGVRIDGGITSFRIENLVISIVAPAPIKAVAKPVVFGFANGDTATGSHTFRGGRIVNSHNDNPCITFNSTTATNKSLRLVGDVELQNRSTATNSISSANARNIVVSLAHATKPVSSNITIQGGTYMVDPIF